MQFNEIEVEAHPVLSGPRPTRRRKRTRATILSMIVVVACGLVTMAMLVDSLGGRSLFHGWPLSPVATKR